MAKACAWQPEVVNRCNRQTDGRTGAGEKRAGLDVGGADNEID